MDSTDTYVRVTGQLKSFHNKRHIGAHHIRPVTDHNEVLFHLLEATSIHLYNTHGPPDGTKSAQTGNAFEPMDGVVATNSGNENSNGALAGLEPLQRQIMTVVHNTPSTNEGVHVQTIAQTIQISSAAVMAAVEQLTTEGLLYTTIDEDHVKFPSVL
jgi:replication factor A2